jgi:uncharacterized protein (TIGR00106 family)
MLVELSIFPLGSGESLKAPVAAVLDLIDQNGLPYQLTAMGTLIEGEWDEVMCLVKSCHETLRRSHRRVITTIKIDDREGARDRLTGKVRDVESALGRRLKT